MFLSMHCFADEASDVFFMTIQREERNNVLSYNWLFKLSFVFDCVFFLLTSAVKQPQSMWDPI